MPSARPLRGRVREVLTRIARLPDGERNDAVVRLMILSGLRKAVLVVKEEVEKMSVRIDIENNEFLKSVFVLGEAKGEARGEARGEAKLLLRQLRRRFGALPESTEARILAASADQLDAWGEAVLSARTLEEFFGVATH